MLTIKKYLYAFSLGIITIGLSSSQLAFARNHHKRGPPPPVVAPKDTHLNPKQGEDDMTPFAQQAVAQAQQQEGISQNVNDKSNAPAALIPRRYATSSAKKVNGGEGWVNSKHRKSKYDLGINAPVAQTADPTQNKTRGIFRRAMPISEPNY